MTDNAGLRALLTESGWTQEELARAVNAVAAEAGRRLRYDRTSVAHWLRGVRPRPGSVPFIAEALCRRLGRTVTPGNLGLAGHSPPFPQDGDAERFLAELVAADADPVLTHRLGVTPYQLREELSDWAARVVPGPPSGRDAPGARRVGLTEVHTLRAAASLFSAMTESHGGGRAQRTLSVFLAHSAEDWLRAQATPEIRSALLTATAHLALLSAQAHIDQHSHGVAQRYLTAALRLTEEAGDQVTGAIVLRMTSAQAHDLGHHRYACRAAEAALPLAGAVPPHVKSFLHAQLAVTRAARGDRRAALSALRVAEHEQDSAQGTLGPFGSYDRASVHYQRARTLRHLGDLRGAAGALGDSIAARPAGQLRAAALTRAELAGAHLQGGRLEEACAHWADFLDDYGRLRSGAAHRALAELRRGLRPYRGSPVARHVLERAETMVGRDTAHGTSG